MNYAFRLKFGCDIKKAIEDYCLGNSISSAIIVTAVGCVTKATIRLADGVTIKEFNGRYEVVSLTGTISKDGSHMHISIADEDGKTFGGHLCYGTLVNTTLEVVINSLDNEYSFSRKFDESTGYDELEIVKEDK